ncbi:MAG: hypothetical protein KDA46_13485 [Parvularculaceae bacterium]|nr:hypothetical protein [Parvularculaceae bacterium]
MRQAIGAFKVVRGYPRPSARIAAAALLLAVAPGCATFGGKGQQAEAAAQASELEQARDQKTELMAEVAGLKAENARLQTRVMELERKAAAATRNMQLAQAATKPAELKDAPSPELTVKPAPSTAPAAPVVAAPETIVDLPEAPVPVDDAPRLVQPTFASTEQIFENEAKSREIEMSSVLWGVHLASYRHAEEAVAGWNKLQRENPDELGLLEPRIEKINIDGKGEFLRLVGGGFSSQQKAMALCRNLEAKGLYCRVSKFGGDRLSMADASSGAY